MIVNSGNLSEIPDQTALMHGPGFFTIELPEDDDGNAIPLDAAVEDTTFLDELYDSYLPVCQLIKHFVVHQHGPSVIKKWMKNHPWEPLIHMFSAPDIVYTLFLLENYGHDEGWRNLDKAAKTKGKHTSKGKKMLGKSNVSSSGQEFMDVATRNWKRDLKKDSVSSLVVYLRYSIVITLNCFRSNLCWVLCGLCMLKTVN